METNALFQAALALTPPWQVSSTEFSSSEAEDHGQLDIHLSFQRGARFACPECGDSCPVRALKNPRIQLPEYRFLAGWVTGIVEPGGALAVPVTAGDKMYVVLVRLLEIDGGGAAGPVVPVGALCNYTYSSRLILRALSPEFGVIHDEPPCGILFGAEEIVSPLGGHVEDLMDLVTRNIDPEAWEEYGNWINPHAESLYVSPQGGLREKVARFVARLEKRFLRPLRIEVEHWSGPGPVKTGAHRAAPAGLDKLIGAGVVQTIAGRRGFVVAGTSATHIADFLPERDAKKSEPVIARTFQGMAAQVRPVFTVDGSSVDVELAVLLATRHRPKPTDATMTRSGILELVEPREVRFETTVRAPLDGAYVLDAGPDPTDPKRRLALVIRPMAE
jgi:hypothetical protein